MTIASSRATRLRALDRYALRDVTIAVPGRHEAQALTDSCPDQTCRARTRPASVLDLPQRAGRVASYACTCGNRWLSQWPAPTGTAPAAPTMRST